MGLELDGVNGIIKNTTSDGDVTIKGNDGGSEISALILDMSDEGTATFNHDIKLGTDQIAKFGDAANLQIYANNINSFITESGSSGNLKIQGQTIRLEKTTEEIMLRAVNDAQVELYYDNVKKLETTSTGIAITGGFAATVGSTITTADNTDTLTLKSTDTDADVGPNLRLYRAVAGAASDAIGTIDWAAQDAGGGLTDYASAAVTITDATDGNEDGTLTLKVMNAGSLNQMLTISGPETVVNEGSKDHDFRVESNSDTHMLFVDGGNNHVNIGTSTDHFGVLNVESSDNNVTLSLASTDADENTGPILMLYRMSSSPADGDLLGKIEFHMNDSIGQQEDMIKLQAKIVDASHGAEDGSFDIAVKQAGTVRSRLFMSDTEAVFNDDSVDVDFRVESNNQTHMFLIDGGAEFVSTGDTAPDVSRLGLCLNQAGNDGNILSFKSSDVAHGVTDLAETDTWFAIKKFGANDGAAFITSFAGGSSNCALYYDAVAGSEDTGKGTGDHGCINLDAQKDNGTDKAPLASNGNLLTVSNDNNVRFILDAEGDIHVDGSGSLATYDTYEDAHLVRAYDLSYGQTSKGLINSKFDKFINYNHDSLVEAGIIGVPSKKKNEDGTETYGLLNTTAMQRLHNGAIWQQYEKHQQLAEAVYEMAKEALGKDKADAILNKHDIKLLN